MTEDRSDNSKKEFLSGITATVCWLFLPYEHLLEDYKSYRPQENLCFGYERGCLQYSYSVWCSYEAILGNKICFIENIIKPK